MSQRARGRLLWRIARHEGDVRWMLRLLLLRHGQASTGHAMAMLDDYERGGDERWWMVLVLGGLLLLALWRPNTNE